MSELKSRLLDLVCLIGKMVSGRYGRRFWQRQQLQKELSSLSTGTDDMQPLRHIAARFLKKQCSAETAAGACMEFAGAQYHAGNTEAALQVLSMALIISRDMPFLYNRILNKKEYIERKK